MIKTGITIALILASSTAAFATTYTVYKGRSDKVVGSCSDQASCVETIGQLPGKGETIQTQSGTEVTRPGLNANPSGSRTSTTK